LASANRYLLLPDLPHMGVVCSSDTKRRDYQSSSESSSESTSESSSPPRHKKKGKKKRDRSRSNSKKRGHNRRESLEWEKDKVVTAGGLELGANWEVTDANGVDNLTGVQRKRLSMMGKAVGEMDYEETAEHRANQRRKLDKVNKNDIKGVKRRRNTSRDCEYIAVSKKGYVPYDKDKKNQDSVICQEVLKTGLIQQKSQIHFFGVADGHGVVGHFVSQFVTKKLPLELEKLLRNVHYEGDLDDDRICDIFQEAILNVAYKLENSDIDVEHSGTTLCCSLIYNNMVYTANVGDSQAMILLLNKRNQRNVIDLNTLHKPDDPEEKARIEAYGGVVAKLPDLPPEDAGPYRVWNHEMTGPGLAMSRSLGDGAAHELGVSNVPTIDVRALTRQCKYITWGSDGVFEFLSSDEVSKIMLKHETIKGMAQAVVNAAVKRWRCYDEVVDDISCVILKLPE